MMVPGKVSSISGSASSLGLGPAVFDGFGTRLGVSRLQVASAGCGGTRMSHRFRARGFRRILGLGPAVFGGFGTRLGVSRLQVALARCRGTRMSHRGFRRILGLGPAVWGRFGMRFLFRGLVSFAPFLMDLILGPVSRFRTGLAPVSLHCRRRFLWTPLVLFQVVAIALVCPQFID